VNVRALPIGLSPVSRETLGSYLHRLADANHITIATITHQLGLNRRYRRGDDDPTNWTARTVFALAALTSRTTTTLTQALPALRLIAPAGTVRVVPEAGSTLCVACRCCMAGRGIHGLVIQQASCHDCVCLRHGRWLRGPEQHPLHALPELCTANRRHRRLLRQHDIATLDTALTRAQQLTHGWLHGAGPPDLQHRWQHRLDSLRHDPYADPYRPSQHRIEVATYPEVVILTTLLTSTHWQDHPRLSEETQHRLDLPQSVSLTWPTAEDGLEGT
jgi:hypothetical protein